MNSRIRTAWLFLTPMIVLMLIVAVWPLARQGGHGFMRELARKEGIFCGVSSGGSVAAALELSQQVENAVIVAIICDRCDRYLSSGIF